MTWALRLRRVFAVEIATCQRCGGKLKVIGSIEDSARSAVFSRAIKQLGAGVVFTMGLRQAVENLNRRKA
jgi:hypothetical protein